MIFLLLMGTSFILCLFYVKDYSTVSYLENGGSKIIYGKEAFLEQNNLEYKKEYKVLNNSLINFIISNLKRIRNETNETNEEFYKNLAPYSQGWYIVERICKDSGDKLNIDNNGKNNFYELRKQIISEKIKNLEGPDKYIFLKENENIEEPFSYYPMNGWSQMLSNLAMLQMFILIILGIFSSMNFSVLYETNAIAIIGITKKGSSNLVTYKILSYIFVNLIIYFLCIGFYLFLSFQYISKMGGNSAIQLISLYSPYNLTLKDILRRMMIYGFCGCIYITILSSFFSFIMKNSVRSIGSVIFIGIIYIIENYYIKGIHNGIFQFFHNLIAILPFSSADIYYRFLQYDSINIFGKTFLTIKILIPCYLLISLFIYIFMKYKFRNSNRRS